jgi:hypothetical protein
MGRAKKHFIHVELMISHHKLIVQQYVMHK